MFEAEHVLRFGQLFEEREYFMIVALADSTLE